MSKAIEIKVGSTYTRKIGENEVKVKVHSIDIPKREVWIYASGASVENPDKPRNLSIAAFTQWLRNRE